MIPSRSWTGPEGKRPSSSCFIAISVLELLLLMALLLVRYWQGPRLLAYRVAARPLAQTVVASGRVVSVTGDSMNEKS